MSHRSFRLTDEGRGLVLAWPLRLLPATLAFGAAIASSIRGSQVLASARRMPGPRRLPPTMYTQYFGIALALACVGLICLLKAFQVTAKPARREDDLS